MPKEQRKDVIRVMFQIELAHWFYLDLMATERMLPRVNMTVFTRTMFQHIAHGVKQNDFKYLKRRIADVEDVVAEFKEYKAKVPTYGAIILNPAMTQCIMVQGFGGHGWGFPKGKINDSEDPIHCAIRELKEETGFDCEHLINDKDVIKKNFKGADMVLYIICGVDQDQGFRPECRNEIKHIKWFDIDDLPDNFGSGKATNMFYMAIPFIAELREWIRQRQQQPLLPAAEAVPVVVRTPNRAVVQPVMRILTKSSRPTGRNAFWTELWDHVTLDWKCIWNEVDAELALINA